MLISLDQIQSSSSSLPVGQVGKVEVANVCPEKPLKLQQSISTLVDSNINFSCSKKF